MNTLHIFTLLPLIVLAITPVIIMLVVAFYRNHRLTVALTLIGTASAFVTLLIVEPLAPLRITTLLVIDHYALFYMGLLFVASFIVALLSQVYLTGRDVNQEEYYILLLLSTLGAAVLATSNHFVSFFLGLEILSVSLYSLIAYLRTSRGIEAGIKYLILAAASAAFLLFGMALVYAELGTMEFPQIASKIASLNTPAILTLVGLAMIITGIGFKLAVVPFHMWTPDIYEGAPAPVTAFVATVSKGAVFVLLLRYFTQQGISTYSSLYLIFILIAIASMFVGNILALFQNNVKRILAYSSIAHLGYLLVAFLASSAMAVVAVSYYLVAYFVTTLGAFSIITVLSGKEKDTDNLSDYQGLAWRRPWLALVFTVMLFSLAGIPLTAGFIGKFYIILVGAKSALWVLVLLMVLASSIGLYYYLRIIVAMYSRPEREAPAISLPLTLSGSLILAVLTLLLLWLGVYPGPLLEVIQKTVVRLI